MTHCVSGLTVAAFPVGFEVGVAIAFEEVTFLVDLAANVVSMLSVPTVAAPVLRKPLLSIMDL